MRSFGARRARYAPPVIREIVTKPVGAVVALIELPGQVNRSLRQAEEMMEASRRQLEAMQYQTDSALEQAEKMNDLLTKVVKLTEPIEKAQRGGEYVAGGLKRALFGLERAVDDAEQAAIDAERAAIDSEDAAEEAEIIEAEVRQAGGDGPLSLTSRPSPGAGLCDTCRHQKLIGNTRGSTFSLCLRSRTQPEFPRYPRLPVAECPGYERGKPAED